MIQQSDNYAIIVTPFINSIQLNPILLYVTKYTNHGISSKWNGLDWSPCSN